MLGIKSLGANDAVDVEAHHGDWLDNVVKAEKLAFVVTDQDRIISHVGGDLEGLVGTLPEAGVVGRRMSDLVRDLGLTTPAGTPILDDRITRNALAEALGSTVAKRKNVLTLAEDGSTISISAFFPGDGSMLTSLRDVSRIAADRLMLDAAVRGANAGYWSMNLQTGAFDYSESVLDRLSDRERSMIKRNGLFAILAKDDVSRMAGQWQDIINGVAPFDLTYRVETEMDGLMWQRSIGHLQRRPDGKLIRAIAFVMDISADMQNRADLEKALGLAKAKEDFMARMSHEIRTPLNAIIGMADSLSDEAMSETVRDVVNDMEEAAENLNALLSRTLDYARLENGDVTPDFEEVDPRETLQSCAAMWRAKAKTKGLEMRLAVAPDVPERMPLDPFRLRQCLNNLIGNAIKFTEKGQITLVARHVMRDGRPHLAVIVQDTGIGMSEDEQATVFDPYRQADDTITRQYGGTGLGLSICRQLAGVMRGEIHMRSVQGSGTAVLLFLPVDPESRTTETDESNTTTQEVVAPTAKRPGSDPSDTASVTAITPRIATRSSGRSEDGRLPFEGLSVLCVEDNPVNQKVVKRLIESRVQQLHFANHGREALSILNTVHVDVVLMDVHMPVMDGIETTMEIRNSNAPYANVIIIALTADPDYQQTRICRNIGMDDTIAKPVRREDILQAFNRTMSRLNEKFGVRVALA